MRFTRTEWHQVSSEFQYDIDDDAIAEEFGSVERFKEILSWSELAFRSNIRSPVGEEPSEEEMDKFHDFIMECDYDDREDDWWTDRKGGYSITYDLPEDELLEGMDD